MAADAAAGAGLGAWIAAEEEVARREMLRSISATTLVHRRTAFGQEMRPARGSVLASPVSAHYDPDPDYFFHWQRDTAVVLGALVALIDDGVGDIDGHGLIADIVAFTRSLDGLDGRTIATDPAYGTAALPEVRQYLRSRDDLAAVHGERIRMEPRFNPDGSLDILGWARPQIDGVAARAIVLRDYGRRYGFSDDLRAVLDADIAFTLAHAGMASVDIWEERCGGDYYTRSVAAALLAEAARDDRPDAAACHAAAVALRQKLDGHWAPERSCYRAMAGDGPPTDRDVDCAVVFAALHSGRARGPHSIADPRIQASLATLSAVFAADYAINRARPGAAPAMGRFRGDVYISGGAFYFSTLAASEFHYRLAETVLADGFTATPENQRFFAECGITDPADRQATAAALIARGDAFLETVKAFTPASGALSEQFDQNDGRQTSARHLTWSYAAFLTAAAARRRAMARTEGR